MVCPSWVFINRFVPLGDNMPYVREGSRHRAQSPLRCLRKCVATLGSSSGRELAVAASSALPAAD
eukprot:11531894-Prorocentrum_lima.AAC.1